MTTNELNPTTKPVKQVVESIQLPSKKVLTPTGVKFTITASPHRNGNPDHSFYEAWFQWEGGTLRSSAIIHDDETRDAASYLLTTLTGVDYSDLVARTLNKYDWRRS